MSGGEGLRPADFCAAWTEPDPRWLDDPTGLAFVDVAQAFFSCRLAARLRAAAVKPRQLTAACGGAESAWRNKLNGSRAFQLNDLLAIAAAFGVGFLDVVRDDVTSEVNLVPEKYASYVRFVPGTLPVFEAHDIAWREVANRLATWAADEVRLGREVALTRDVMTHRILLLLESEGLPSRAATVVHDGLSVVLEWVAPSIRIDYVPNRPPGAADGKEVRDSLTGIGSAIWRAGTESTAEQTIVVATPPPNIGEPLATILDLDKLASNFDRTFADLTLSLSHAHRLGLGNTESRFDLPCRIFADPRAGVLLLEVKR